MHLRLTRIFVIFISTAVLTGIRRVVFVTFYFFRQQSVLQKWSIQLHVCGTATSNLQTGERRLMYHRIIPFVHCLLVSLSAE